MNSDDLFPAFLPLPVHLLDDLLSLPPGNESCGVTESPVAVPAAVEMQDLLRELQVCQKALAISKARFDKLFDAGNDAGLLLLDQHYVDCNEAALRLVGAQYKGQLVGQSMTAFVLDPQPSGRPSAEMLSELVAEAISNGSAQGEMRLCRATGEGICVEVVLTAIERRGAQSLLHIVWRDVTASRLATAQLRQSEARLSIALDASATGVIACDFVANEMQLDERSRLIYGGGFAPGPLLREHLQARFHPDDRAGVMAAFNATLAFNVPFARDHRVLWPDGSVHFVSVAGRLVPDAYGVLNSFAGVVRDVTAQHTAAQELHYKSLVLENLLTHLPIILSRFQPDGLFLEAMGAGLQVLGMTTSELVGHNVLDLFPAAQADMQLLLRGGAVNFLSQSVTAGRAVAFQNFGFFDEQQQQAIILAVDVTEAEQRKDQLRLEKEFTQSLLENTVDGIVALDQDGCIMAWNAEMTRYTGLAAAAVLARPVLEVLNYLDGRALMVLTRALAGERFTSLGLSFQRREGLYDAFVVPLQAPRQDQASGVLIIVRDVTERDKLVEVATQLRLRRQQEVLSAVLATQEIERRRIAEALHNSLGQLLYATKLSLEGRDGVSAPPRDSLNLLEEAIRATRTISFELTPSILEDFGLRTALGELIKRIAPARLPVQLLLVNLDKRLLPEVEIAVYRMVQELLNNVMKHAQATEVIVHVAREHGRIAVSVEDNGRGFEPIALTEQPLTGIGLPGVRNRVALLGGEVIINSRLGRGTIISFELNI